MTTMVKMIRNGKPYGEPTGLDDALAREWEQSGKCVIIRDKPEKPKQTKGR